MDKRLNVKKTAAALLCALVVWTGVSLFARYGLGAPKAAGEALYDQVELLAEAITIIRSDYVNEVEPKRLIYGALKGVVESLDRHSQFMDPTAFTEMQVETKGEFGGVGLEITVSKEGYLTVVTPMDDTPAANSGLKPNDKIVKIDDQSTRGISLQEAVKKLRGRVGTKVNLSIFREPDDKILEVTLTRAVIKIRSVKDAKKVADNIGYVRIAEFQDSTGRELKKAVEEFGGKPIDGLILDLRNNPGGLLDVAVEVTGLFIQKGKLVVSTKGRVKDQNMQLYAKEDHPHLEYPMVVLINGGSASASEIVADALQDHQRAILMGTKSFGKGSVQTVIPLRDGSALRLTTSLYYTPSGRTIHGEGLQPDIVVEEEMPSDEKETAKPEKEEPPPLDQTVAIKDPVLLRAIDLLKGLKVYQVTR